MFEAGIVDPAKVERVAMQNAVSVASLLLTTEATVTDIKEDRPSMPDMSGMPGGMPDGMPGGIPDVPLDDGVKIDEID